MFVTTPIVPGTIYAPLNHHDYGVIDDSCMCSVCLDWRVKFGAYQESLKLVPHSAEDRDDRGCKCSPECKASIKFRSAYLGALHRRNLYCESSWHASVMEPSALGEEYMRWVKSEIEDRATRTDGWWEKQGSCFPMAYWLTMFRQSMMETVSGAVTAAAQALPKSRMDMVFVAAAASGAI